MQPYCGSISQSRGLCEGCHILRLPQTQKASMAFLHCQLAIFKRTSSWPSNDCMGFASQLFAVHHEHKRLDDFGPDWWCLGFGRRRLAAIWQNWPRKRMTRLIHAIEMLAYRNWTKHADWIAERKVVLMIHRVRNRVSCMIQNWLVDPWMSQNAIKQRNKFAAAFIGKDHQHNVHCTVQAPINAMYMPESSAEKAKMSNSYLTNHSNTRQVW